MKAFARIRNPELYFSPAASASRARLALAGG